MAIVLEIVSRFIVADQVSSRVSAGINAVPVVLLEPVVRHFDVRRREDSHAVVIEERVVVVNVCSLAGLEDRIPSETVSSGE